MGENLTPEQQYWTLNGNFEALQKIQSILLDGSITSAQEIKDWIVTNMNTVHTMMCDYEGRKSQ